MINIKNIRHYGISVRNEERALHLYRDLLGFKIVKQAKEVETFAFKILKIRHVTYIKLERNGQLIELYIMPKDRERGVWSHIALTVENLSELYKTLREEKIRFISEPVLDPSGEHKLCFCRDYDGNLLELVQELKNKTNTNPSLVEKPKKTRKKRKATPKKTKKPTAKKTKTSIKLNPTPFNKKQTEEVDPDVFDKEYTDAEE